MALSGEASTAWVLIQLNTIHAIHFYSLPGDTPGNRVEQHSTSSLAGAAAKDSTAITMQADHCTVDLRGLHTRLAVAVVLSWAAQLSHRQSTKSIKITGTEIHFLLGVFSALPHVAQAFQLHSRRSKSD